MTTIASAQALPQAIAVDATGVYWTNRGDGTVMKLPAGGAIPTTLASCQDEPMRIALDATSVYWTTYAGGTVMRASK